jgi:D-alanine-D-alanine ligase
VLSKHFAQVDITIINDPSDLVALVERQPDLVFLGMDFITPNNPEEPQTKVWLADFLEKYGIAFTGSRQASHQLEHKKSLAKQCVHSAGFATSPFFVAKKDLVLVAEDITLMYPLFVKPTSSGGGTGIDCDSVVYCFEQLRAKVLSIARNIKSDSLIEEYLPGREFSVAILKDAISAEYLLMPLELVAPLDKNGTRMLSQQVKSTDSEQVTAITDNAIKDCVTTLAINAFNALGARDYGRIDIRMDKNGTPHFLEANLIPSLISGYGSFPKACMLNIGMDYETMMLNIVNLGLARASTIDKPVFAPAIAIPALELV